MAEAATDGLIISLAALTLPDEPFSSLLNKLGSPGTIGSALLMSVLLLIAPTHICDLDISSCKLQSDVSEDQLTNQGEFIGFTGLRQLQMLPVICR